MSPHLPVHFERPFRAVGGQLRGALVDADEQMVRPRLGLNVSLRSLGLFAAGLVTVSGHVGNGLEYFGPLTFLPTLAIGLALLSFVFLVPRGEGLSRALTTVAGALLVAAPGFLFAGKHLYATGKVSGLFTVVIPLILVVSYFTRKPSDLDAFWLGLYLLASIGVGVAVFELISGVDIGLRGSDTGASLNPIAAGRLGGTIVLITVLGRVQYVPRAIQYVVALLGLGVLLGAASRGPLLALMVAVTLTALSYRALRGRLAVAATIVALALIGGVGNVVLAESADRLTSATNDEGAAGRSALWDQAIQGIKIWPEGVGWGNYSAEGLLQGTGEYPHNFFLELAVEAGFIAAFCFALLFAFVAYRLWKNLRFVGPLPFALLMFWFVTAQFSSDINGNRVFILILFGLFAAFRNQTTAMFDIAPLEVSGEQLTIDPERADMNSSDRDSVEGSMMQPAVAGAHLGEESDGRP